MPQLDDVVVSILAIGNLSDVSQSPNEAVKRRVESIKNLQPEREDAPLTTQSRVNMTCK
jgi:hypothetical protein